MTEEGGEEAEEGREEVREETEEGEQEVRKEGEERREMGGINELEPPISSRGSMRHF